MKPDGVTSREDDLSIEQKSIGAMATSGLFWAIVQNWGGRLFTFVLFIVLARFLDPTDFGTASAAALVLLLIGMIAEFGFGDAIVQRRDLEAVDVNAPFFLSLAAALVLAGAESAARLKSDDSSTPPAFTSRVPHVAMAWNVV